MLKALQRWLRKSFADGPSQWSVRDWTRALRGEIPGVPTLASLMRSGAIIACSQHVSDQLASAPLSVIQRMPTGGVAQVTSHPAVDILATLDFDQRAASVFDLASRGNGWLWLHDGALFALDGSRLLVTIDADNQIWLKQQGIDEYIPSDDTVMFRWRFQAGFYLGWHPAMMCSSISTALAIQRMGEALARNITHPGGILEAPEALGEKAIVNIKKSWQDAVGGPENTGKIAVLEEGVRYRGGKELGIPSAADAQMCEAMNWSIQEIARLYNGLPNSVLNLTHDVNKATAAEESKLFWRALRPFAARIDSALTRKLISPQDRAQGIGVEHDLSEMAIGSGKERAEYLSQLVNAGVLSSDEARNSIGYEDIAGGSGRLRVPANTLFADQLGNQPAGGTNGATPKG